MLNTSGYWPMHRQAANTMICNSGTHAEGTGNRGSREGARLIGDQVSGGVMSREGGDSPGICRGTYLVNIIQCTCSQHIHLVSIWQNMNSASIKIFIKSESNSTPERICLDFQDIDCMYDFHILCQRKVILTWPWSPHSQSPDSI